MSPPSVLARCTRVHGLATGMFHALVGGMNAEMVNLTGLPVVCAWESSRCHVCREFVVVETRRASNEPRQVARETCPVCGEVSAFAISGLLRGVYPSPARIRAA